MTPLHVAAEKAHNDVMEVLHKHGAKVNMSKYILWEKARGEIVSVKYSVSLHYSCCLLFCMSCASHTSLERCLS